MSSDDGWVLLGYIDAFWVAAFANGCISWCFGNTWLHETAYVLLRTLRCGSSDDI